MHAYCKVPSFLLYINNLPENIFRLLVDIYANDTTFYGSTSKDLDDQSFAPDLSSNLAVIVQPRRNGLVTVILEQFLQRDYNILLLPNVINEIERIRAEIMIN